MIKKLCDVIRVWYNGTETLYENDPNSNVFIIGFNREIHWTARVVRYLCKWYLENWKWFWGIIIPVCVSLFIAFHSSNLNRNSLDVDTNVQSE